MAEPFYLRFPDEVSSDEKDSNDLSECPTPASDASGSQNKQPRVYMYSNHRLNRLYRQMEAYEEAELLIYENGKHLVDLTDNLPLQSNKLPFVSPNKIVFKAHQQPRRNPTELNALYNKNYTYATIQLDARRLYNRGVRNSEEVAQQNSTEKKHQFLKQENNTGMFNWCMRPQSDSIYELEKILAFEIERNSRCHTKYQ